MRNSSNRILLTCLYIGALSLLSACSQVAYEPKDPALPIDQPISTTEEQSDEAGALSSLSISKVSIISQDGVEVPLDSTEFEAKWESVYSSFVPSEQVAQRMHYTVISWNDEGQPAVMQLYPDSLKVGQDFFSGQGYESFLQWVRESLGSHYFGELDLERMTLQALDIGMKAQVPEAKADSLFSLLQQAVLQKGDIRIKSPLYPYYKVDVEYGGKKYLSFDIITPTLISLQDGQDRWYYQLNQSLLSELAEVIPLQDYSVYHVKHLFQASGLEVDDGEAKILLDEVTDDQLRIRSHIHEITRYLATAQPVDLLEHWGSNDQQLLATFTYPNEQNQQVYIYDHYFIYEDQFYDLMNVQERFKELVASFQ
ncbi:hypothetical protein [Bacillus horti]|uniref:Uncharacterized protein n=1 Tax=Caldalkalibacillus horti TaxID=77523 RepID=A0ABT9VUI0_9BACI|nr:hypothetical protein [Bacillus horti]MDQ0164647.1 hypothetical protein [Bacillus horti]